MDSESDCLVFKLASPFWARHITPLCLFICNMRVNYSTEMSGELSELIVQIDKMHRTESGI